MHELVRIRVRPSSFTMLTGPSLLPFHSYFSLVARSISEDASSDAVERPPAKAQILDLAGRCPGTQLAQRPVRTAVDLTHVSGKSDNAYVSGSSSYLARSPGLSCEAAKSIDDQACSKMCDPLFNTFLAVMATNNMSVREMQVMEDLAHTVAREHPAKGLRKGDGLAMFSLSRLHPSRKLTHALSSPQMVRMDTSAAEVPPSIGKIACSLT